MKFVLLLNPRTGDVHRPDSVEIDRDMIAEGWRALRVSFKASEKSE